MSLSSDRSTSSRLTKEIADLRGKEAAEIKKEADAVKRMNAALASANRASSPSTASMYASTAARESKNAETAQGKRAGYSSDIARKSQELSRLQDRIAKAEETERKSAGAAADKHRKADEKARKDLAAANERLRLDYESKIQALETQIAERASSSEPFRLVAPEGETEVYDVFISHAWKDKEDFVDGLAAKARDAGLRVWYDQFSMVWGDSVRQKIDLGLASSYFGVVVLSPNFFERPWTGYELDGLLQRDLSGQGRVLPIWHRLTQDDVAKHAPSLAGRLALNTSDYGTDAIVKELVVMRDRFRSVAQDDDDT